MTLSWKPNKGIAAFLGFFLFPLGLQYAGAPRRALLALLGFYLVVLTLFVLGGIGTKAIIPIYICVSIGSAIWASRIASATEAESGRHWSTRWYGLLATMLAFVILTSAFRIFLYEPFRARTGSMQPAVPLGASVIVQKWGYGHPSDSGIRFGSSPHTEGLQRGDIIAFDFPVDPRETYLKRLVGLPGDKINYVKKHLFINGVDARGPQLGDYFDEERLRYLQRFEEHAGATRSYTILVRDNAPGSPPGIGGFEHKDSCTFDEGDFECRVPASSYFVLGDDRDNSFDSRIWGFVPAHMVVGKVVKIIP